MTRTQNIGSELFIAGGSVTGRTHVEAGRNNQDAFAWSAAPNAVVAVVCDGCSAGAHSEVGAQIGACLLVRTVLSLLATDLTGPELLVSLRSRVLAQLARLTSCMAGSALPQGSAHVSPQWVQTVLDYFLFTIVGVVLTPELTLAFSIGDGLIIANSERLVLGPFADNEPPYLGYGLLPRHAAQDSDPDPRTLFRAHPLPAADAIESLLIGTDGLLEIQHESGSPAPLGPDPIGPLSQFWTDERFFTNPDRVRRRLAVISRGPHIRLADDTTLIAMRRRRAEEA